MWPKRFFGARYYAFRYFPQTDSAPPAPTIAVSSNVNVSISLGF
jgi:hypothetical protein